MKYCECKCYCYNTVHNTKYCESCIDLEHVPKERKPFAQGMNEAFQSMEERMERLEEKVQELERQLGIE